MVKTIKIVKKNNLHLTTHCIQQIILCDNISNNKASCRVKPLRDEIKIKVMEKIKFKEIKIFPQKILINGHN